MEADFSPFFDPILSQLFETSEPFRALVEFKIGEINQKRQEASLPPLNFEEEQDLRSRLVVVCKKELEHGNNQMASFLTSSSIVKVQKVAESLDLSGMTVREKTGEAALIREIVELLDLSNGELTGEILALFKQKSLPRSEEDSDKEFVKQLCSWMSQHCDSIPQELIIRAVKCCIDLDVHAVASSSIFLHIYSEEELFKIAQTLAQRDPRAIAEYFNFYLLSKKDDRFSLARSCVEQKGHLAEFINNFALNKKQRIQIAQICARSCGQAVAQYFKRFRITDRKAVFEIAEQCIASSDHIPEYISNFDLSEGRLLCLAELCAKKCGGTTAEFFKNFRVRDEDDRIRIAELCIRQNAGLAAMLFKQFQIFNPDERFRLAMLCAAQEGRVFLNISEFDLMSWSQELEVMEVCARQKGGFVAYHFQTKEWKSAQERVRIALACAEGDRSGNVPRHVKNFGIDQEAVMVRIAERCAQKDGLATAECFFDFRISAPEERLRIATLCVQNEGGAFFYIKKFKLNWEEERKLFFLALRQNFEVFFGEVEEYLTEQERGSLPSYFELLKQKKVEQAFVQLKRYASEGFPGFDFDMVLNDRSLADIRDPYAKQQLLTWLGPTLFYLRELLTEQNQRWILENRLLQGFFSMTIPHYRHLFRSLLVDVSAEVREAFDLFKPEKNQSRWMLEQYPWGKLLRLSIAHLLVSGIDQKNLASLLKKINCKLFKDDKKFYVVIDLLRMILNEKGLDSAQKNEIFHQLNAYKNPKELFENVSVLHSILKQEKASRIERRSDYPKIFVEIFEEIVLLPPGEQISPAAIVQAFESSRSPQAIYQYASGLKKLNEENVMRCLGDFVASVTQKKFSEKRNSIDRNPHLAKLSQISPEIKSKWETPLDPAPVEQDASKRRHSFSYLDWIQEKLLTDRHMDLAPYPRLARFLSAPDDAERKAISQGFLPKTDEERFESQCILLWENWKREEERKPCLEKMLGYLEARGEPLPEFHHDIKGVLKSLSAGHRMEAADFHVYDTDDPFDLLLCGTEVTGSCQRLDGDPTINKGLLGYLMDGKIRLIAIKDQRGRITARALLRILFIGDRPVLFLDRIYTRLGFPHCEKEIYAMAKKKAETLGIPLYGSKVRGDVQRTGGKEAVLRSLGGPAPYEYCDGATGLQREGIYSLRGFLQNPIE